MFVATGARVTSRRSELTLVLALYLIAAALMPLAHHDIVCHLKSATHCTTCQIGSSAEESIDAGVLAGVSLDDAGNPAEEPGLSPESASGLAETGRAPPAD